MSDLFFILIVTAVCFLAMLLYFRIADKYNIIDKPNERSSHTSITIRGGGVVYIVAGLAFFIYSGFSLPWFWAGFLLIGVVSFVDDVKTLSSRVRLPLQFLAVLMLVYQALQAGGDWWLWAIALVLATGIINAYNFMDGINGITAGYSFVVLLSLLWLNQSFAFADSALIVSFIAADLVFAFFNFRKKARTFAGDVGSVTIAFAIVYLLLELVLKSGSIYFIMLLAVYGVDSVLTIVYRLRKRENIFEAHRSHLYQWMVKPGPFNHLQMSGLYMIIQAAIALIVIRTNSLSIGWQGGIAAIILVVLGIFYIAIKASYKRMYGLV
jgi:UDP-N-acetylmuramyl pentapeptide phosphotransferase/UDP-N-acetylglucosamine-1-phosphate transferase